MQNRIRKIRKESGLNQTEFGERIGIKQNTVTAYETGRIVPSDGAIINICREFNVSEHWLRTGEGDPHVPLEKREQLNNFFGDVLNDEDDSFRIRFLSALASYTEDDWKALEHLLDLFQPPKNEKGED